MKTINNTNTTSTSRITLDNLLKALDNKTFIVSNVIDLMAVRRSNTGIILTTILYGDKYTPNVITEWHVDGLDFEFKRAAEGNLVFKEMLDKLQLGMSLESLLKALDSNTFIIPNVIDFVSIKRSNMGIVITTIEYGDKYTPDTISKWNIAWYGFMEAGNPLFKEILNKLH